MKKKGEPFFFSFLLRSLIMARLLLVLTIVVVPALEIGVFILVGKKIGLVPTLLLIGGTSILGVWLAKKEGLQVLKLTQLQLKRGDIPSEAILDGICILIGGILLISPGFITDALGFLLLIPYTRGMFKAILKRLFQLYVARGGFIFIRRK